MRRRTWVLLAVGVVIALVAIPASVLVATFAGDAPLEDGRQVGPATTVVDGIVAAYPIPTSDGFLLVDAGQSPDALLAWLEARGSTPSDVRALFITHGHGDHIGACAALPDATVYALASEQGLIEGDHAAAGPVTRFARNDGACQVDVTLEDGQRIAVGERSVEVFAVPGHTEGSAAYLVDGALFLGDAASASREGTLTGPKWIFSNSVPRGERSLAALASRLEGRVEWLVPAHTGPLAGSDPLVALAAEVGP